MVRVGVDLHQRFCCMTALEARGKIVQAGPVTNEKLALRRYFRQFRGQEVEVAVEACGFWPAFREVVEPEVKRLVLVHPQRVKAIASAKLKNEPGGFGDAGAFAALRFVAGVVEGGPGDAGAGAASAVAGDAGAAADAAEEPGARGAASEGAAFAGDGFIRQRGTAVAGRVAAAGGGAGSGERVLAAAGWLQRRSAKTKSAIKGKSKTRQVGRVADDDTGDRGVFGDDAAGRDRRHRTISR